MTEPATGSTVQFWRTRAASWLTPGRVHALCLVLAALAICVLARRQWFFYDEWAFLAPNDGSILQPHVGHLSLLPIALTRALRAVFGLSTYWPYYLCALAAHLVLSHLLWRVMRRAKVEAWTATAFALLFMVFGTGSENILWAFQVGYMGAMCFGVAALLLVVRPRLGVRGGVGVAVLTAAGLATAGTSLPFVAVAILLSLRFRGLRTTVVTYIVPVGLYLAWYASWVKDDPGLPATPPTVHDALTFLPQYAGSMFANGFDRAFAVPGIGAVLVACLVAWVVLRAPRLGERRVALPAAMLLAGLLFALLSGYARYGLGLAVSSGSRYVYFVFAASVPVFAAGAGAMSSARATISTGTGAITSAGAGAPGGRPNTRRGTVIALVLAAAAYNVGILWSTSVADGIRDQGTRRQVYAALDFALHRPDDLDRSASVDPRWAPTLTPAQLLGMHRRGWIEVGHYRREDMLDALAAIATRVTSTTAGTVCNPHSGLVDMPAGATLIVELPSRSTISLNTVATDGAVSSPRLLPQRAGRHLIRNMSPESLRVGGLPSGSRLCQG